MIRTIKVKSFIHTYINNNYNELSYLLKKSGVLIIFYKPKTVPVNWVFVKLKPKPAFSKNLTRNPFTNFDYVPIS